jgi:hypothetical protein
VGHQRDLDAQRLTTINTKVDQLGHRRSRKQRIGD